MDSKTLLIVSIILALFLSSCSGYSSNTKTTSVTDFHTGTEGLYMRFLPETPPTKIYSNSPLEVMVEYANHGAYPISDGRLYLSGYDNRYISIDSNTPKYINAEAKSVFNPYGKLTNTETFSTSAVQLPTDVDRVTQTIKATACYDYKTEASIEVCIDPKTTDTLRESVCQVQTSYGGGSQGAPLAVTSVEEEIYNDKVQFRIYLSNVGGGTVMKEGKIDNCHTSLNRDDANKVWVESVEFAGKTMSCQPTNYITLDNSGNGFVYCYYQGDLGTDAYKTMLQIKLRYAYRSSIQQDIEILKAP